MSQYKHWWLESLDGNVLHLQIDTQDSSVNVLSQSVLDELQQLVEGFEKESPTGLIISSAKGAGFLAGADINEFLALETREDVVKKLRWVQDLFLRVERLPCRTVAMIHGHCLGGGLELALSCKYRVADNAADTKIGLPEVKLGIHPGYGGAVRLPRLINPLSALNLILAGRLVSGKQAAKLGIVDRATQKRHLLPAALALASGAESPRRKRSFTARLMGLGPARSIAANLVKRQLAQKVREDHYPAPYRMLEFWRDMPAGQEPAYQAEAESLASIFEHPNGARAVHNLVQLFLRDREVKNRAKKTTFNGKHIHVVGAGVMGGDIAAWCALRGFQVTLQDAEASFIAPAMGRAHELFKRKLREPYLVTAAMDRLVADPRAYGVKDADIVIEAISEKLEAKASLYAEIEPKMKTGAILASNTSSIPLEDLAAKLADPERLVGIHFFNPVPRMQLVEVVRGKNSGSTQVDQARAFVSKLGKLPIDVVSSPGFLVNRVLMAYLSEALRIYEEGVQPAFIDSVSEQLGFPMGPIELADTVGLDICQAVAGELVSTLGGEESDTLKSKVEQGDLGRKSGKGFYVWKSGKPQKQKASAEKVDAELVRDRMLFALLNEAVQCLAEGIVGDADSLDLAMVFGTGFPPFLGGPMTHLNALGKEACLQRLSELEESVGSRFAAKPGWAELKL